MLPASHPFQRFLTASAAFLYSTEERTTAIHLAWGLEAAAPLDLTGVNRLLAPDARGAPRFAPGFELTADAQRGLLAACAALRAAPIVKKRYDASLGETTEEVGCSVAKLRPFARAAALALTHTAPCPCGTPPPLWPGGLLPRSVSALPRGQAPPLPRAGRRRRHRRSAPGVAARPQL